MIVAVVEDGPRMAFCAYDEEQNILLLEECLANGYEVQELVQGILTELGPTLLLLPSRIVANHDFFTLLTTRPVATAATVLAPKVDKEEEDDNDDNGDDDLNKNRLQQQRSIPYRILKTSSLDVRTCKSLILSKLRVQSLRRQLDANHPAAAVFHPPLAVPSSQARPVLVSSYHALASVIDFQSKVQMQAVGSLLSFLQNAVFSHHEGGLVTVSDIRQVHSNHLLFVKVPCETLSALHIFATDFHPLLGAKGSGAGASKEGFSLFSFLDRTKSRAGRERLREWMLKPLRNVQEIARRQDGIQLFLPTTFPELQLHTNSLVELLRNVGPVTQILARMQKSTSLPHDFLLLPKALGNAISILQVLYQDILWKLQTWAAAAVEAATGMGANDELEQQQQLLLSKSIVFVESILHRCHLETLQNVLERITATVDEDATAQQDFVVIRRGFNPELDEYKEKYFNLGGTTADCQPASQPHCACFLPPMSSHDHSSFSPQVFFVKSPKILERPFPICVILSP